MAERRAVAVTGGVLAAGAIVLAVIAAQISQGLTSKRAHTCDGMLPMPFPAFAFGWAAVAAGLAAVVLYAARWRRPLPIVLAVLVLAAAGFVLYTVYGDAPTHRFTCSG